MRIRINSDVNNDSISGSDSDDWNQYLKIYNEIDSEEIELDEYEENEEEWFWDSFDMQDTPIQNEKEIEKVLEKNQIIKEKEGSNQNTEAEKQAKERACPQHLL
ncbi:MAG: hypothetical protein EZS28_008149 [Streblomastix strix]|uniref:Uncharacterized protein n=1 Tax=Streblomastix strix TaxID=222440 RepID=A0A5J4WPM1_9EUKA|nr:MAG: hypothetical protein EZS28_008149 [Streblomastix strix]